MFGKKKSGGPTLIGEGSELEGTLRIRDGLQVDGSVEGTVEVDGGISVGPKGVLRGEVRADSASVAGTIEGTLVVEGHLHLLATGRLEGEVEYGSLQVERGGELSGRTGSLAGAKAPALAAELDSDGDEDLPAAAPSEA